MASSSGWYLAQGSKSVGPVSLEQLRGRLRAGAGMDTLVYGPGMTEWTAARHVAAIVEAAAAAAAPPPPPSGRRADEIDYEIFGEEMQYVEITLDPGEMVIAEAGAMMYMSPAIAMETRSARVSDPAAGGSVGRPATTMLSAGKRVLTGESLFMTTFTNSGSGREVIAFASPYPGKVVPMHLDELGGQLICQKDAFLCAARGIQVGIAFQKRIGVGLFGGEGFIMQRLTGDGIAMVHAGGTLMRRTLRPGEMLKLDTGCLVALTPEVDYDIQFVGGVKNTLFGGEGLFLATLSRPFGGASYMSPRWEGEVWCQSLPFSRLAGRVLANAPQKGGRKGEGSILGGLGRMLGGDTD